MSVDRDPRYKGIRGFNTLQELEPSLGDFKEIYSDREPVNLVTYALVKNGRGQERFIFKAGLERLPTHEEIRNLNRTFRGTSILYEVNGQIFGAGETSIKDIYHPVTIEDARDAVRRMEEQAGAEIAENNRRQREARQRFINEHGIAPEQIRITI